MPRSDRKLACPIIGIHANNDVLVPSSRTVAAWSTYTTSAFTMHQIDGTHFFFFRPPAAFVVLLQSCLDGYDGSTWPGPGAYELETFWWGTLDLHTYPYGVSPKGHIIYTEGHVFVHLCDPLVDPAKPLAAAHSHTFYHGTYDIENGAVFHNIEMSNNPNDHADVLGRYFHWQEEERKLTLSTQPDLMRAAGGTLIWQRLPECGGNHRSSLEGAWRLVSATEIELTLGMLVIRCGKLMLQLQKPERPRLPDIDPEHVPPSLWLQKYEIRPVLDLRFEVAVAPTPKIPGHGGDKNDNNTKTKTITFRLAHADLQGVYTFFTYSRSFQECSMSGS